MSPAALAARAVKRACSAVGGTLLNRSSSTTCARRITCADSVARATSCSNSRRCFAVSPTTIRRHLMPHWTHVRHLDSMTTAVH